MSLGKKIVAVIDDRLNPIVVKEMRQAAADLEFEHAAELRDEIQRLQSLDLELREARVVDECGR